jgi:hypothetical protein
MTIRDLSGLQVGALAFLIAFGIGWVLSSITTGKRNHRDADH